MKAKRIFFAMLLMGFVLAVQAVVAYAAEGISVTIDGEQVVFENQQPALVDGRTLVPVRGVFEHLGFEVNWISATQTVTLDRNDFAVRITVDSATFTTNGETHTLDVPAQVIGGSTMLPIRAVLESVGYYLDWEGSTQTVLIRTNNQQDFTNNTTQSELGIHEQESNIILPNRVLTAIERQEWVDEYWALGGPSRLELEVLALINEIRAESGLPSVTWNNSLGMAARFYTQQMSQLQLGLGHEVGPYFTEEADWVGVARVFGVNAGGSVAHRGSSNAQGIVDAWMRSLGHRMNLLNPRARYVGMGHFRGFSYMFFNSSIFFFDTDFVFE